MHKELPFLCILLFTKEGLQLIKEEMKIQYMKVQHGLFKKEDKFKAIKIHSTFPLWDF